MKRFFLSEKDVVPGNAECRQAVPPCSRVELFGTVCVKKGAESSAKLFGFRCEPLGLYADSVPIVLLANTVVVRCPFLFQTPEEIFAETLER